MLATKVKPNEGTPLLKDEGKNTSCSTLSKKAKSLGKFIVYPFIGSANAFTISSSYASVFPAAVPKNYYSYFNLLTYLGVLVCPLGQYDELVELYNLNLHPQQRAIYRVINNMTSAFTFGLLTAVAIAADIEQGIYGPKQYKEHLNQITYFQMLSGPVLLAILQAICDIIREEKFEKLHGLRERIKANWISNYSVKGFCFLIDSVQQASTIVGLFQTIEELAHYNKPPSWWILARYASSVLLGVGATFGALKLPEDSSSREALLKTLDAISAITLIWEMVDPSEGTPYLIWIWLGSYLVMQLGTLFYSRRCTLPPENEKTAEENVAIVVDEEATPTQEAIIRPSAISDPPEELRMRDNDSVTSTESFPQAIDKRPQPARSSRSSYSFFGAFQKIWNSFPSCRGCGEKESPSNLSVQQVWVHK